MLSSRKLSSPLAAGMMLAAVAAMVMLAASSALAQSSGGSASASASARDGPRGCHRDRWLNHRRHDLCGVQRAAERQCRECKRQCAGRDRRSLVGPDARRGRGLVARGLGLAALRLVLRRGVS